MSIEGDAKEAAGYVKEELNKHGRLPEAGSSGGRDLSNEGRAEDGKALLDHQPRPAPESRDRSNQSPDSHTSKEPTEIAGPPV